jgi:hypothetical protein
MPTAAAAAFSKRICYMVLYIYIYLVGISAEAI